MRAEDRHPQDLFLDGSLENRIPAEHPLPPIRAMRNEALKRLDARFDEVYGEGGRPSIAPERLLRAQLLMLLDSIRSERMLVEQLRYNLLFRWFVGLGMDEELGHPTVFPNNRDRLPAGEVAREFFGQIVRQAKRRGLISSGQAEREAAVEMAHEIPGGTRRVTLAADRGYDTREFVERLRELKVRPHAAQNRSARRSAVDGRTVRHEGYG